MVLSLFVLVVILILVAAVVLLAAWLGALPGRIAKARAHPQAEAINACGWLGLITLGAPWIVAMVWAYLKPRASHDELLERLERVETKLARIQNGGAAT